MGDCHLILKGDDDTVFPVIDTRSCGVGVLKARSHGNTLEVNGGGVEACSRLPPDVLAFYRTGLGSEVEVVDVGTVACQPLGLDFEHEPGEADIATHGSDIELVNVPAHAWHGGAGLYTSRKHRLGLADDECADLVLIGHGHRAVQDAQANLLAGHREDARGNGFRRKCHLYLQALPSRVVAVQALEGILPSHEGPEMITPGPAARRRRAKNVQGIHRIGVFRFVERSLQVIDDDELGDGVSGTGAIHEISNRRHRSASNHDPTGHGRGDGGRDVLGRRGRSADSGSLPEKVADPALVGRVARAELAGQFAVFVLVAHNEPQLNRGLDIVVVPRGFAGVCEGCGCRRFVAGEPSDRRDDDLDHFRAVHKTVGVALTDCGSQNPSLRQHRPPARRVFVGYIGAGRLDGAAGALVVLHEVVHLRDELVAGDVLAGLGNLAAVADSRLAGGGVEVASSTSGGAVLVGTALDLLGGRCLLVAVAHTESAVETVESGAAVLTVVVGLALHDGSGVIGGRRGITPAHRQSKGEGDSDECSLIHGYIPFVCTPYCLAIDNIVKIDRSDSGIRWKAL